MLLTVYFKPGTAWETLDKAKAGMEQSLGLRFTGGCGWNFTSNQIRLYASTRGDNDINRTALSKYPMIDRVEAGHLRASYAP